MPRRGENIRKRKDGRWEGRYYTEGRPDGGRNVHSIYAKTYGEVREKLSEAKQAAKDVSKKQGKPETANISVDTVAGEWLSATGREKKQATCVKYGIVYKKYIQRKIGQVLLPDLSSKMLAGVFQGEEQEGLSNSLQNSIACVLNQILDYASMHYSFTAMRYARPSRRQGNESVTVLSASEQTKLFQYLYDEMDICKLGIVVCISTGLRLGEICSLKWKDIDFEEKIMCVNTTVQRIPVEGKMTRTQLLEGAPKSTFSRREIPLSEELAGLLLDHRANNDKYVLNKNRPMEPRTYQNKFQKYLREAGVKKTNFHTLRHTFATNCVNSGVDIKSLSEILGHSDVRITLNRYIHPSEEIKRMHMNALAAIYGQFMGQK